jgi:hypothetical protein
MVQRKGTPRLAARAGKNPAGNIETTFDSSKYAAGGARPRPKKGGIVRKPAAKIRYKKSH